MSVWDYIEQTPDKFQALAELYAWGANFAGGSTANPFPLFLDIVGYSQDNYGSRASTWGDGVYDNLGWVEMDYLGKALCVYADRPSECDDWLTGLLALETD